MPTILYSFLAGLAAIVSSISLGVALVIFTLALLILFRRELLTVFRAPVSQQG